MRELPFVDVRPDDIFFGDLPSRIARELQLRNWSVPGIEVGFERVGSGEVQQWAVTSICCDTMIELACTGDVIRIANAGLGLDIYLGDDQTPTLELLVYEGTDWDGDKGDFFSEGYFYRKRDDTYPYNCHKYGGVCYCTNYDGAIFSASAIVPLFRGDNDTLRRTPHTHSGEVPPLLAYKMSYCVGEQPKQISYNTREVVDQLKTALRRMLDIIVEQPAAAKLAYIFTEEDVPWPSNIGPIFAFCGNDDVSRIRTGQNDPSWLVPNLRFALHPYSHSRQPGYYDRPGIPRSIVEEGQLCGLGSVLPDTPLRSLSIPGVSLYGMAFHRGVFVLRILPNRANGIFVVDFAARENAIPETGFPIVDKAILATCVPITEYRGDFGQPAVVITRELGFDEVEIVSGPWTQPQLVRNRSGLFHRLFRRGR